MPKFTASILGPEFSVTDTRGAKTRAKPFRLQAPVLAEHPLQKQIADVLRLEFAPPGKVSKDGVVWWSIDHANYAGVVPGIRVGRGIIAGIPDVFVLYRGCAYHIEIKTEIGVMSDAQMSVCAAILSAGGHLAIVRNANELLEYLDEWGIPRAHRVQL